MIILDVLPILISELRDNGFIVRYTHPNLLFVSWAHWMPAHVRDQFKKQTGTVIDGFGNEKVKKDDNASQDAESNDPNALLFGSASKTVSLKKDKGAK